MGAAVSAAKGIVKGVFSAVSSGVKTIVKSALSVIKGVGTFFNKYGTGILSSISRAFPALGKKLKSLVGSIKQFVAQLWKRVGGGKIVEGTKGITPGLKFEGKIGKLTQHAKDWNVSIKGGPQVVASRVEKIVHHIYNNTQLIKQGMWRGDIKDAIFYSNGKHIIVTKLDGTFVTILKNAQNNKWFQNASKIWSK